MAGGDKGDEDDLNPDLSPPPGSADPTRRGAKPKSPRETTVNAEPETTKLQQEITRLKLENARLDGKLRGYSTLNQLFQESKDQCRYLQEENQDLKQKIKRKEEKEETKKNDSVTGISGLEKATIEIQADKGSPSELGRNSTNKPNQQEETVTNNVKSEKDEQLISVSTQESVERPLSEDVTVDSDVADPEDLDISLLNRPSNRDSGFVFQPSLQHAARVNSAQLYGLGSLHHPSSVGTSDMSLPEQELSSLGYIRHGGGTATKSPVVVSRPGDGGMDEMRGGSPMSIHVAEDLSKMATKTAQLEQSERQWKAFASTLQAEVQKLRKEFPAQREMVSQVRAENVMLLQRIKKLEHERDALSPADSVKQEGAVNGSEWVHVSKQQALSGPADDTSDVSSLLRKLHGLELNNNQLLKANKEWELYRYQTECGHQQKITELQSRLEASQRELTEFHAQDEKRQREIDKMLLTSKRQRDMLESEKEDLTDQLEQCKHQIQALELRLREQQQQPRQNQLSAPSATPIAPASPVATHSQLEEIINEKEALKQQLTIFKEDFDKERDDRAKAQSEKDALQRNIGELSKQLKRSQAQQKSAEDSLRNGLSQNEQLHQQVASLRRQLKSSEESLRRCLEENDQLRLQIQQIKHQQSQRPNVVTPPPTGRPFFPPTSRTPQSPRWPAQQTMYQSAQPAETGPELLPGLWQCPSCTYVNYPRRTVCEMCGAVNHQLPWTAYDGGMEQSASPQGNYQWSPYAPNTSADPRNLVPRGLESTDLTTDSGRP